MHKLLKVGIIPASLMPSLVLAQATAYDVSAATAEIDNVGATLAVIGVALVALAAIALDWHWVKGAFF